MDTETEARQDEAAYLRCQVQLLTDEVERLRLTKEEREAIDMATTVFCCTHDAKRASYAATLRGLLERIK